MSSREFILNKLKNFRIEDTSPVPPSKNDKDIFSDYPENISLSDLFKNRFTALNGELHLTKDIFDAGEKLNSIVSSIKENKGIFFASKLIKAVVSNKKDLQERFDILEHAFMKSEKLATYSFGLTTAEFLIARTGSIVLNSLNHGGRRLSVLPPIHIVIAESSQIVFSLDDIFRNGFLNQKWSYATIISGPSRTSDIEKQLVLGAHGPKRLILILIENT